MSNSVLLSFLYMYLSSFSSATYWIASLFSIVVLFLCHRLISNRSVSLFLDFLSCFIDLCLSTILSWFCSFVVKPEVRESSYSSPSVFLSQNCCDHSGTFLYAQFFFNCSSLWKICLLVWKGLHWLCRLPWVL